MANFLSSAALLSAKPILFPNFFRRNLLCQVNILSVDDEKLGVFDEWQEFAINAKEDQADRDQVNGKIKEYRRQVHGLSPLLSEKEMKIYPLLGIDEEQWKSEFVPAIDAYRRQVWLGNNGRRARYANDWDTMCSVINHKGNEGPRNVVARIEDIMHDKMPYYSRERAYKDVLLAMSRYRGLEGCFQTLKTF